MPDRTKRILLVSDKGAGFSLPNAAVRSFIRAWTGAHVPSVDLPRHWRMVTVYLSVCLPAGNFLNKGNRNGEAVGFQIETLLKLREVRSTRARYGITEMNRMRLVLFDVNSRILGPRLAATDGIAVSVMCTANRAAARNSWLPALLRGADLPCLWMQRAPR
jgi:Formin Homology 2 Domain